MLRHAYTYAPSYVYSSTKSELTDDTLISIVSDKRCEVSEGVIYSGLDAIGESVGHIEQWRLPGYSIERGVVGDCYWSRGDNILCVAISVDNEQCKHMANSTERAYCQLLETANGLGFTHLLRFWNYLPAINQGDGDSELYKQFCLGRHKAFVEHQVSANDYPSASALGHHSSGAVIFGFVSSQPGQHIENPAQVSAYQYPREYGPKSPSFARATMSHMSNPSSPQARLFVSGTASVLGSNTVAAGDISTQLSVTVENLEKLITNAGNARLHSLKVYIRELADLTMVTEYLNRRYPNVIKLYTHADVCRANLLVEIEALGYAQ
ncbi:MAG: chorismate lyase/3-hydroxybenzoate synthase [Kiritimatiellia bacterium]|jgi:chorismate lyase/3-hydroxybenzoate synthase